MKIKLLLFFQLILILACTESETRFESLDSDYSGIEFNNQIIENDSINILTYDYTYNGGGVAIADFNNDGQQDIFFSANMTGNKLYLNKGNMTFSDISTQANIGGEGKWCTAAIAVDINHDGWMDIYVPASSTTNSSSVLRENLLYVNQGFQGKIIFKEESEAYGVNDSGFSEGAAFFDYDNDGDLDLYVLTNVIDHTPNYFREKVIDGSYPNNDRLYRNDQADHASHPIFTDVTIEAGIVIEGFGLGINITDLNKDGWKDIYITNDYAADDLMYINNQDGTFTDQAKRYFKHTNFAAMGNDIADINNDGLQDIIALDMMPQDNYRKKMFVSATNPDQFRISDQLGYTYQYMRNTLQLNSGLDKNFHEISLLAGVAETDWSWTPSLADFDNDGMRDLLITNGFPKDVTDKDFMSYRTESQRLMSKDVLLKQIPEVRISNYGYRNNGGFKFEDVTDTWGLNTPSFSSGASYGDLDADGDLDYVVNNTNDLAFMYENKSLELFTEQSNYLRFTFEGDGKNPNGIGAIIIASLDKEEDYYFELNPYRGYKSTVESVCHIGLGERDKLKNLRVVWPNGKTQFIENLTANQTIKLKLADAKEDYSWHKPKSEEILFKEISEINYTHQEFPFLDFNIQNSMPFSVAQMGPGMAVGDVNGDMLDDLFFGGSKFKKGVFYIQNMEGGFSRQDLLPKIDTTQKRSEDTGVLLFDADLDGDQDLYIVSGGNEDYPNAVSFQDRFYENIGNGHFEKMENALPNMTNSGACVRAADYDQDGDLDLFISGRNSPMEYPKATSSTILRNDSEKDNISFVDVTDQIAPSLLDFGMICDALWTDFDNDGDADLIVAGDFMAISIFENKNGKFEALKNTGLENYHGIWNSITAGDYDQDGDIDYIIGNVGENALFKGTQENPASLLSGDFDNNERYDVLPFHHFPDGKGGKVFAPYNGKGDISRQLNPIRTRFTTYKAYSEARFDNLLTEEEMSRAIRHDLTHNATSYIENLGAGKFNLTVMPIETQFAPINGMITDDFNKDGFLDVLMVGNNFGNEMLVGKMDAHNGLLLLGRGNGAFEVEKQSGFEVSGDAKALVYLFNKKGEKIFVASQNKGKAKVFSQSYKGSVYTMKPGETKISYSLNGNQVFFENYYGSSYLSQSSRKVFIPEGAKNQVFK